MKFHLFFSFLLIFGLASGFALQITHASANATVSIANLTSEPGETVNAPILISNVDNYGTGTISITYDPVVVHVTSVSSGPYSTVVEWNADNTSGIVIISALNTGGVSGDIIFANVTFHAVRSAGSTPLNLSVITLKNIHCAVIPATINNGSFSIEPNIFDPGEGTYPSIFGVHRGNFTPKRNITVQQMYTYPCAGTGGHSERVVFYEDGGEIANCSWNGYKDDYHNISFKTHFTLHAGVVYTYEIRTGSYPQIIHRQSYENDYGIITCTEFTDANGRGYNDWIPAIKLSL